MARAPKWLWLLAATVALLRMLPFAATFVLSPPAGESFLHVGYMPEDMHAYLSFIRQAAEEDRFLFDNRYVATEQDGRFVLIFHWLIGLLSKVSTLTPQWTLELSRIPLVFLFFGVAWWFLEPIFGTADGGRRRAWAMLLIGASGGVEGFVRPLAKGLPESIGRPFLADTWHLYGWNTFESLYNPLWIAGLSLFLLLLRPLLAPAVRGRPLDSKLVIGIVALFFVHPYSALVVLAIGFSLPFVRWGVDGRIDARRGLQAMLSPALAAAVILAVSTWQRGDPVFAASAGEFFGRLHLPVFWYPVTFAAVLALAFRGGVVWVQSRHPYTAPILAWIGVVVLLHTSSWINGYHFVLYLHIPLAILAATVMPEIWDRLRARRALGRAALVVLLIALFANPALVTVESIGDLGRRNLTPRPFLEATRALAALPPGRVLAPPQMGLLVPAYSHHSTWAGHWFLTPDYWPKVERYGRLVSDPGRQGELLDLVHDEGIDYLVVPAQLGDGVARALGSRLSERRSVEGLELLTTLR